MSDLVTLLGDVVELSMKDFKDWLANGDTKQPINGQGYGKLVLGSGELKKLDTISSATNLASYGNAPKIKTKKKKKRSSGPRWLELKAAFDA